MVTSSNKPSARGPSPRSQARALAALMANGGNVSGTARLLKMSPDTLRRWRDAAAPPGGGEGGAVPWREYFAKMNIVAQTALDVMSSKIADAPLNQVTSTAGFAINYLRQFADDLPDSDQSPILLWKLTDEHLDCFERLLALLLDQTPGPDGTVGGDPAAAGDAGRHETFAAGVEPAVPATPLPADAEDNAPELHLWLAGHLQTFHERRGSKLAVIAPRGSAKTTLITLAYVLRCAVVGCEPYILLLSDSKDQAVKYLQNIRGELETAAEVPPEEEPPPLATAYPDACGKGPEWRKDRVRLRNGVVIEALGRGSRIRGRKNRQHRPTLVVIDDCQSNRDIRSAAERSKALEWFKTEVLPCGTESTNFISIGSALHRDAVAVQAQTMPGWTGATFAAILSWPERADLWAEWERLATNLADAGRRTTADAFYDARREDMDRGGVSFWPACHPLASLMMKRAEIGTRQFDTEYQGVPGSPEGAEWPPEYFDRADLWFTDWPENIVLTVVALDPSKGKADDNRDFQAHAIVALGRDGILWVECECRREPVPEMVERAVDLARDHRATRLAVETNQGLDLLVPEFDRVMARKRFSIQLDHVEHYGDSKVSRIRRLGAYLSRKQIRIRDTPGGRLLVDQFRDFPNGAHDDAPDAVEIAIRRLELMTQGK